MAANTGDAYIVGAVGVSVEPVAKDFWRKFVAESSPGAEKVGVQLGQMLARPIAKQVTDAIVASVRDAGRVAAPTAVKTGEGIGAAIVRGVKTRLDVGLRDLPRAKIKADLADVERGVAATEAAIKGIGDGRVRIGVHGAVEAIAELAAVKEEADRLDRTRATVHVGVDDGAGSVGQLENDANSASGGIRNLIAVGITLGPALIPVALTTGAAIASIGAGALGAGAAVGVLALALKPLTAAISALSAQQDNAAQTAVTAAGRQNAIASAMDMSRNAALSLTQAEREELRAQQALTQARVDAKRALEDLSSQTAGNALEQRQAALDLKTAAENLTIAKAGGQAGQVTGPGILPAIVNPLAVQEAQLAFDRAKQHAQDLATQGQRLAQDQAAAQKRGVDGSTQVVAAQDRLVAAQDAVTRATQGIAAAQRELKQAYASASIVGETGAKSVANAMANLTPIGQRFARWLYGLRPVLLDLSFSAQNGLFPGLQRGIQAILPLAPKISAFVGSLATTLGDIFAEFARSLTSPFWQQFFQFVATTAGPQLQTLARILGFTAAGVAGLVQAFAPLSKDVGGGLLNFAQRFAYWSTTLTHNKGFIDFLAYVRREGPIVVQTIGDLVVTASRLIHALTPIGDVILAGIEAFSEAVNQIPIPVLTALSAVVIGIVAAMKVWNLAQAGISFAQKAAAEIGTVYNKVVDAGRQTMAAASASAAGYIGAVGAIRGAAAGAKAGVGQLIGLLGGPWGIAITAATLALGALLAKQQQQRQVVAGLISSMRSYGDLFKKGITPDSVAQAQATLAQDQNLRGLVSTMRAAGVSQTDLIGGLNGDKAARLQVIDAIQAQINALQQQAKGSLPGSNIDQIRERNAIYAQIDALTAQRIAFAKTNTGAQESAELQRQLGIETAKAVTPTGALADALQQVANKATTADDRVTALKNAEDRLTGAAQNQADAQEHYAASVDDLTSALDHNGQTLDVHTAKGRANIDALKERLKASNDVYYADIAAGVPIEKATKLHDERTAALIKEAKQYRLNKQAVQDIVNTYGEIPTSVTTAIKTTGYDPVKNGLLDLKILQLALQLNENYSTAQKTVLKDRQILTTHGHDEATGKAMGGPIDGLGSRGVDSVPILAAPGEYMQPTSSVDYYGVDTMEALRRRTIPRDALRGYASGGLIQWPFNVDVSKTFIPSRTQVLDGPGQGVGPGAPTPTGPVPAGLQAIQAWIRAQAGKPYIWDSAGPRGFDCSGIVSAVANLLAGRAVNAHTFSTSTERGFFPLPGFGTFTAGWSYPGERAASKESGHTAGNLAGLAFESRGGDGVVVGPRATPVTAFARLGHMDLRPYGFDSGGWLKPGDLAYSGTRKPEAVLTNAQWELLAHRAGSDGASHVTNIYPQRADFTVNDFLALEARRAALQRDGRTH